MVETEYNKIIIENRLVNRIRDLESLRNKFKQLKNTKKPTGDPTCPVIVITAKRIMKKIEEKCVIEDFDDNQILI